MGRAPLAPTRVAVADRVGGGGLDRPRGVGIAPLVRRLALERRAVTALATSTVAGVGPIPLATGRHALVSGVVAHGVNTLRRICVRK
jgi:hypothetical protein